MEPDLPESVGGLFQAAGFAPGRLVPTDAPREHPAHDLLRTFSGLHVGSTGRGETCASSDIQFTLLAPESDDDGIRRWEALLGVALVGIGEVHNAHGELWVASDGRCFVRSLMHDAFSFAGDTFGEAMARLLLGRRLRPLIHPKQGTVEAYGETYTPSHPDVYDHRASR